MQAAFLSLIYTLLGCSFSVSLLNPCFFGAGSEPWGIYYIKGKEKTKVEQSKKIFFITVLIFQKF